MVDYSASGSQPVFCDEIYATWKDKKVKYRILVEKNKNEFHPETFKIFMQAPCGVLLTKVVLKDLGLKKRYSEVKIYKKTFFDFIKDGCANKNQETRIYINKDIK